MLRTVQEVDARTGGSSNRGASGADKSAVSAAPEEQCSLGSANAAGPAADLGAATSGRALSPLERHSDADCAAGLDGYATPEVRIPQKHECSSLSHTLVDDQR